MFAIGHFALGYLAGIISARKLHTSVNIPLLLTASVIPDIDLILIFLPHRGPTHSLITIAIFATPFLLIYRKNAIPYIAAVITHSLIGDLFGGVQLIWPLSTYLFGFPEIGVRNLISVTSELILFMISTTVMIKTGDIKQIWKQNINNLALIMPIASVLGPMLLFERGLEYALPPLLIFPSLFYLAIFAYSIYLMVKKAKQV